MLVVMAVQAQQLPVAAIRGIVVVVVIAVMDGEFPEAFAGELPAASCADVWQDLECASAVALLTLGLIAPEFGRDSGTFRFAKWSVRHGYCLPLRIVLQDGVRESTE
jgi:hypothetical protein